MARLIVFDTTEVLRVWPRTLHAALAELEGTVVTVPPTVGVELAPMASPEGIAEGETEAERRARDDEQRIGKKRMNQLRRQAWWARMWRVVSQFDSSNRPRHVQPAEPMSRNSSSGIDP